MMQEVNAMMLSLDEALLHTELSAALGTKVIGISSYGPSRPISIWLDNSATGLDLDTAKQVAAVHDASKAPVKKPPVTIEDLQAEVDTLKAQIAGLSLK